MSGGTQFVMTSKFDNDQRGISSSPSTSVPRTNRSAWLSSSNSKISIKVFLSVLSLVLLTVGALVSIPFVLSRYHNKSALSRASIYHNRVNNSTMLADTDNIFKYFDDLHKLSNAPEQLCDLKPESRQELGRGTWAFLHIMAAAYPPNPTPQTIQEHKLLFQLLPRIYPCPDCRQHMRKLLHELPPRLNTREEFIQWICDAHNRVNARLGKPVFDCSTHDERWDCGCGITPGKPADEPAQPSTTEQASKPGKDKNRSSKASRKTKNGGQI